MAPQYGLEWEVVLSVIKTGNTGAAAASGTFLEGN